MSNAIKEFERRDAWGLLTCLDIYDCDHDIIRNKEDIRRFVAELCELIEMRRYGETQVVHFGEDEKVAGFSMTQLIETSLISAHFANKTKTVYLDVFSCKPYEPDTVADFSKTFFKGAGVNKQVIFRR